MSDDRLHHERLVMGDALGHVLKSCHASDGAFGVAIELIERSDGHLGVADAARYFVGPQKWSETSQFACEQASGRILDVGAGAGRVSLALQDAGYDVVALDVSEGATAVCRERGVRQVFTGTVADLAATRPWSGAAAASAGVRQSFRGAGRVRAGEGRSGRDDSASSQLLRLLS